MKFLKFLLISIFTISGTVMADSTLLKDFYSYNGKLLDGKDFSFNELKNKAVLIVNTASQCGFTSQYEGLQKLYEKYQDKNFVVLGFPSNDFGQQEPSSDNEIANFCKLNYGVSFPMFQKSVVKGSEKQPLFSYLIKNSPEEKESEIKWNFEKFLVNREGKVVARFRSSVEPLDVDLEKQVVATLK
jgi:glutathione peroxidase